VQKFHAERLIYAIDARQSLQMKQVFGASKKAGYARNPVTGKDSIMEHAAFGAILGEDGRPFKTRTGESVKLQDLLDETASRTLAAVRARSADLPEADAVRIAESVGMAALKYADLCNDRIKDYVFSSIACLPSRGTRGRTCSTRWCGSGTSSPRPRARPGRPAGSASPTASRNPPRSPWR
jgi:arginyl-tRNA synthetase